MTPNELAVLLDVSERSIARILNGVQVQPGVLRVRKYDLEQWAREMRHARTLICETFAIRERGDECMHVDPTRGSCYAYCNDCGATARIANDGTLEPWHVCDKCRKG
jgi:hypothetical protein